MYQSDQNADRQSATLPHPQQPELMTRDELTVKFFSPNPVLIW